MSDAPLVFLDANILFSTALGGPAFALLLDLAHGQSILLTTSEQCVIEAQTNLERKRPDRVPALAAIIAMVSVQPHVEVDDHVEWAHALVHADDVHVLAAARRAGADVLLTGDTSHFGPLMERDDLGLAVRTPRAFLLEGPPTKPPGSLGEFLSGAPTDGQELELDRRRDTSRSIDM